MTNILEATKIGCSFGALLALREVSISVPAGSIVGLVGPNGAGKTSLLNCISGVHQGYTGSVRLKGEELSGSPAWRRAVAGISRTFQTPRLLERESVETNVALGCEPLGHESLAGTLLNLPNSRRNRRRDAAQVADVLETLGLTSVATRKVGQLPFARRRIVEIGRALAGKPQVLLLDEPAAGLEVDERDALQAVLRNLRSSYAVTMVVVEHDVRFLSEVADSGTALNFGQVIASGPMSEVLTHREVREAYFGERREGAT